MRFPTDPDPAEVGEWWRCQRNERSSVTQDMSVTNCKQALYRARISRPMALPCPPGSPIALLTTGWWHTLPPAATALRLRADPGGLLERIPSPLTLASDLGKGRSPQRLALDT